MSSTPHDDTISQVGETLDKYLYAGLYKKSANKLEFSLSKLSHLAKVSKKLGPIKVYAFLLGLLLALAFFRTVNYNPVKACIYAILAADAFRISYNSYERAYASIAARHTLSSTKELGSVVMSFFSCGKKSSDSNDPNNDKLKSLAEEVRWKFLLDSTFSEMVLQKAKDSKLIE